MFVGRCHLTAAPPSRTQGQLHLTRRAAIKRAKGVVRAQGSDGEREMESLFEKELKRRGLDSASISGDELTSAKAGNPRAPYEQQQGRGRQQRAAPRPPPSFQGSAFDDEVPPQLARSRALNSEGLEGFLPRASELLKLGLTFFLAFLPFIAVVSLGFFAIYGVFGDSFVHGGTPAMGPPPYIDPDMLLAEPTADPMIPLSLR